MWSFTGEETKAEESWRLDMVWRCVTWLIIRLSAWMFRVNLRWQFEKKIHKSCPHLPEWRVGSVRCHNFELWLTGKVSKLEATSLFFIHTVTVGVSVTFFFTCNPLKYESLTEDSTEHVYAADGKQDVTERWNARRNQGVRIDLLNWKKKKKLKWLDTVKMGTLCVCNTIWKRWNRFWQWGMYICSVHVGRRHKLRHSQ